MIELELPNSAQFSSWDAQFRPVAVIRAICNNGHPMSEHWLSASGRHSAWGGRLNCVQQEGVNGFKGFGGSSPEDADWRRSPVNSDRPEEVYFRTHYVCARPTCNYRLTFDQQSSDEVKGIAHLLRDHGQELALALASEINGASVIDDHPSGAVGLASELNALIRVHRRVL